MKNDTNILDSLSRLDELCPSGYAIALHISFTTPRFLFQTYSKDWIKLYSEKGLVLKDPTVLWGFSNTGVVLWSELSDIDESGILPLAHEFGLEFGFTFAIDQDSSKSISSFARKEREFSQAEIQEISALISALHEHTRDTEDFSADELKLLRDMSIEFTRG